MDIKLSKHCHLKLRMMLRCQTSQEAHMQICEDTVQCRMKLMQIISLDVNRGEDLIKLFSGDSWCDKHVCKNHFYFSLQNLSCFSKVLQTHYWHNLCYAAVVLKQKMSLTQSPLPSPIILLFSMPPPFSGFNLFVGSKTLYLLPFHSPHSVCCNPLIKNKHINLE